MHTFWYELEQILDKHKAKVIVEVGAFNGENTVQLLKYLKGKKKAKLITIDTNPNFDPVELEKKWKGLLTVIIGPSQIVLPTVKSYDTVLLDGDHSYWNVLEELKIIEKTFKGKKAPVIVLHDTITMGNPDAPITEVRMAIDKFLEVSEMKWKLELYDKLNGLGVLWPKS